MPKMRCFGYNSAVLILDMPMLTRQLVSLLADGRPHHIADLAQALGCVPQQLNHLWQHAPEYVQAALRQRDGVWQLAKPLAWVEDGWRVPPFELTVLPQTTSTSDELLQRVRAGQPIHKQVVAALEQTAGRGRQGRAWQTQLGESLMFSVGWSWDKPQHELTALALVAALACRRGLARAGCEVRIKWPNDLVVGLDKLGGILIETVRQNGQTHSVIGIGINFINAGAVPGRIGVQAACNGKPTSHDVFSAVLRELDNALTVFEREGFAPMKAEYEAAHRDQNQPVALLRDGVVVQSGYAAGVDVSGALLLRDYRGEEHLVSSGEVSLRRPEQVAAEKQPAHGEHAAHYLLLDGGNSRLKWAWVEQGEIVRTQAAHYRDLAALEQDWQEYAQPHTQIMGSAVCGEEKKQKVQAALPQHIVWLGSMAQAAGIHNHYRHVEEHGADRWFNALGSRKFTQNACVVVSCGTAVTIDALTANNHYLGGVIMPGFHLMRESLLRRTAHLNRPEGSWYAFPTTTANAIATGMADAVCGALMLMHARLKERSEGRVVDIVITGGGAGKIARALPENFAAENHVKIVENLVIYGLLNWIEQQ